MSTFWDEATPDAAVVTAIYDGYDTLKPALPQTGLNIDWVCVTNDPNLASDGWRIVYEPHPGMHPNRAAKRPKLTPWEYTDAPASVWIDGSFRVSSTGFVADVLKAADPVAQFAHPWRDCMYDEAAASVALPKYGGEPIVDQVVAYRRAGHPEQWGLWAAGVIARIHTAPTRTLGYRWAEEIEAWSFQDQLSQPFVLRELGLRPTVLPGTHFVNQWLTYEGSGRH